MSKELNLLFNDRSALFLTLIVSSLEKVITKAMLIEKIACPFHIVYGSFHYFFKQVFAFLCSVSQLALFFSMTVCSVV